MRIVARAERPPQIVGAPAVVIFGQPVLNGVSARRPGMLIELGQGQIRQPDAVLAFVLRGGGRNDPKLAFSMAAIGLANAQAGHQQEAQQRALGTSSVMTHRISSSLSTRVRAANGAPTMAAVSCAAGDSLIQPFATA